MRRQEFLDNINDWEALKDFCGDEECDICDCVYTEVDMGDKIDDDTVDWARHHSWEELRDILNSIPESSDSGYYILDEWDDWHEATEMAFAQFKQEVCDWMDEYVYWDDNDEGETEEDESDDEVYEDEDDDLEPIEPESISFTELITSCNNELKIISEKQEVAELSVAGL